MPTATSISGFSLINNGPLTTTFAAPVSCSTAGFRTMLGAATQPDYLAWAAACEWLPPEDCNPSGAAIRSIDSSAQGPNPTADLVVVYHSPALICPSGWATVGAAAKLNPTSTSISGAFNVSDAYPIGSRFIFYEPGIDALMAALDPGETAVLCCPSSYTTLYGACYSTLPSSAFTPTTGCRRFLPTEDVTTVYSTWILAGQTVSGAYGIITGTVPLSTTTTTFGPSEVTSYVGVAVNDMFTLIHQASDITTAPNIATTSKASTTTKTSSAVRTRVIESSLSVIIIVCCLVLAVEALWMV